MKKTTTRTKVILKSGILSLLIMMQVTASGQTSHAIGVASNVFTPDDITITVGDTVIWTNTLGNHNVNGTQVSYPSNPESFGNSVGIGWTYSHVFTMEGHYDYQCDPHVGFGMVGMLTVMAPPPDTLTINFSDMTPHVGQTGWLLVTDQDTGEEIERSSGTIEESFPLVVPGIVPGHSYTIEVFADLNGNGYYDAPPTDHAWRLEVNDVVGNVVVDFVHNTDFTDIEWEHRVILNLDGMNPHVGEEIYFALIDTESGMIVDRISRLGEISFTVELGEIMPGKSYRVDFFSDHDENGHYDAPPGDHAWRLEIASANGDDTLNFVHNTSFTDVEWMHRLKVSFIGMNPHVGQKFTLYVRDMASGDYLDTLILPQIPEPDFKLESYVIEPGGSYLIDFYSDHNGSDTYDIPPTDHAWRLEVIDAIGDTEVEFTHNTNFTDIFAPTGPDILLTQDPTLGNILTDADGFTLYYFTKDALPDTSLCTGGCVTNWPLFYVENPAIAEGLDIHDFSSIMHPEGEMQTLYKGWPLYYFANDLNPGETNGETVGNIWFVAKPDYSIMLINNVLVGKDGVTYNGNYEPGEEVVQYFVDEYGMTLYIFINDTYNQNNFTASDFSNDAVWPIYEEDLQAVASTLDSSLFGSIDVFGHNQLTYNGWPLYYFGGDTHRGDATGVSVPSPGVWPVAVQSLVAPLVSSVEGLSANSGVQIYPNPAVGELNIISEGTIESVTVINLMGARIHQVTNIHANDYLLSLDGIAPGVYFIEVSSDDNEIKISRLIKR